MKLTEARWSRFNMDMRTVQSPSSRCVAVAVAVAG